MISFSFESFDLLLRLDEFRRILGKEPVNTHKILQPISNIFKVIKENSKIWDEKCIFTRSYYGDRIVKALSLQGDQSSLDDIKELVVCTYAFCTEFLYWTNEAVYQGSSLESYFSRLTQMLRMEEFHFLGFNYERERKFIIQETIRLKLNSNAFNKIFKQVSDREKIFNSIDQLDDILKSKVQLIDGLEKKLMDLSLVITLLDYTKGFPISLERKREIQLFCWLQ